MAQLLLAILSSLGIAAKQAWTFAKAKVLLLWAFVSVVLPKIFNVWKTFRLLRVSCVIAVIYLLYSVIRDIIRTALVAVDLGTGISSLLSDVSWASWLVWEGPLQMSVLWDQLIACVSFRISLQVLAFTLTKIDWWSNTLLSGGLGRR